MKTMGSIESVLKDNGYKLTEQRKLIIEVFEEKNGPHTAQEIFDRVKLKNNKIDFSTIYRNLELLSSLNIINKLMISSGVSHFVLQGRRHHHHMICKGCGEMKEIDVCPFSEFEDELRASGFEPTEHRFEIYGYCSKCSCGKE
jgi:Fur family zinc uptake transcriptional regulator/Fur family ferric uptake transcriptional regulator